MKFALFICFVLCCATLVSAGKKKKPTWKKMQIKLKGAVKPYIDFVHVVSAHKDADWSETKKAAVLMTQVVDNLAGPIGRYNSRIGFVQFALTAYSNLWLTSYWYQSISNVQSRINGASKRSGDFAAVGNGLNEAKRQFSSNPRSNNRVVWLVTNRYGQVGSNAKAAAKSLKRLSVKVFVVGIGEINRWKELKKLAFKSSYAFAFKSYSDYRKAVGQIVKST